MPALTDRVWRRSPCTEQVPGWRVTAFARVDRVPALLREVLGEVVPWDAAGARGSMSTARARKQWKTAVRTPRAGDR